MDEVKGCTLHISLSLGPTWEQGDDLHPKAFHSPFLIRLGAGKGCSIPRALAWREGEMETTKIYAASTRAKRGGREPRSETALPKFTMNLQEHWRGVTEGLERHGNRTEGGSLGDGAVRGCWGRECAIT